MPKGNDMKGDYVAVFDSKRACWCCFLSLEIFSHFITRCNSQEHAEKMTRRLNRKNAQKES